jgi:hypothetical protein
MTDPRKRGVRMWSDKGRRLIERGPVFGISLIVLMARMTRPSRRGVVCAGRIWPVRGCEFCPDGMPVGLREAA